MTEAQKREAAKRAARAAKAAEEAAKKKADKKIMIEKAVNLKLLCDYAVSCSYGDIVLIITMLHEYIKLLDEIREDDIQYQAYYRNRFLHIADHLAEQIEYDYDEAVEKCRKKREKEDDSDIGEDAMVLSVKYAGRGQKKKKGDEDEQRTDNQNQEPGAGMP